MSQIPIRFHCRHVHPSGHRCGSPALRDEPFCYHHHTTRRPAPRGIDGVPIPPLEDRTTLQQALTAVLTRISEGTLEPRRASLLLYGLQIAQNNLPPHKLSPQPADTVDHVTLDEYSQPLAPEQEFLATPHEKTLEEILVEQWAADAAIAAEDQAEREAKHLTNPPPPHSTQDATPVPLLPGTPL